MIATLSAGIVGVGDRLGQLNAQNLLYAVRPDGIIVKPDVPAVPTDESILNDAHDAGEDFRPAEVDAYGVTAAHRQRVP